MNKAKWALPCPRIESSSQEERQISPRNSPNKLARKFHRGSQGSVSTLYYRIPFRMAYFFSSWQRNSLAVALCKAREYAQRKQLQTNEYTDPADTASFAIIDVRTYFSCRLWGTWNPAFICQYYQRSDECRGFLRLLYFLQRTQKPAT